MPYKNRQDALDYAKAYRENPEKSAKIKQQKDDWYQQEKERVKTKERERRRLMRESALEELGGKCVICGTTENLEFNHIDPYTKEREVSTKCGLRHKEHLKCELLCKKHHRLWSNAEARLARQHWLTSLSVEERRKRIRDCL
jgi:5-methylcytosine-specific restriction endonuclease McrA